MKNSSLFLAFLFGLTIFLLIIGISALIYQNNIKNTKYFKYNTDDWFFNKFGNKLYNALFGINDAEDIALKLGIEVEEYYNNCKILKKEPNIKGIVCDYIYGFIIFIVSIIFSFLFTPFFILFGLLFFLIFIKNKRTMVKNGAEHMKEQIKSEFPRFLSLLSTELDVGIPIDIDNELISKKYDSLISIEFLESLNDVKLSVTGWQGALYNISEKYQITELSNFVLDVTTAFNKGTSIADAVRERTKDISETRLYNIKEKAARTENAILIPIAMLQFTPIIVFMLLPTLSIINLL